MSIDQSTAEEFRHQFWPAYWRVREQEMLLKLHFTIPLTKMLGEKILEIYPELKVPVDYPKEPRR